MKILPADSSHHESLWELFRRVISTGDTYVFSPDSGYDVFEAHWLRYHPYVALDEKSMVGTYIIKPNQIGLGLLEPQMLDHLLSDRSSDWVKVANWDGVCKFRDR